MLDAMRRWLRGSGATKTAELEMAAAALPPVPPPKVKPKQQSIPSYVKNTQSRSESALPLTERNLANTDALSYRTGTGTRAVIRDYIKATPDLSAGIFAYVRTAITSTYTAKARNMDGTFNRDATLLLQELLTRFDTVQDYSDGFSGIWSLRSTSEALAREILTYGAMSLELVLDKSRLPRSLTPISTSQVQFKQDDKWLKPVQKIGQDEIDLDVPTFFYVSLDQDLLEPYADPPFESALQPVIADHDFFNDLRRLVKRALHPRIDVKVIEEKFRKTIPQDIQLNAEKLKEYTDSVLAQIETMINDLGPEDALVHFDFIEIDYLNHGNASPAGEEQILMDIARSRISSAAKVLPSILGHGGATQNVASAESMLFMKNCAGAVQEKLNEIYSKSLTLALRLFGLDVSVEFRYQSIDLRPDSELEAFRTMKQSRVLELLSLGFLADDEAAIELTGKVTPPGFTPLSGTNFRSPGAAAEDAGGNPYSTTGSQGNTQGAQNQNLKSDAPSKPKTQKGAS